MKKGSTTNTNVIFLGGLVIIAIALMIAIFSNEKRVNNVVLPNYEPIDGAVANSYQAPENILDEKDYDVLIGSKRADLKILVYEDYSNPYSAELAETLEQIMSEYDDVALVTRPFALKNSNASRDLALGYLCAKDMGEADTMRSLLLEKAEGDVLAVDMIDYARELNLDEEEFANCLTNQEKLVKLEEAMDEAKTNLVIGAPTIFVGDEMIVGARPYSDFVDSNGDSIEGLKTVVARKLKKIEESS